MKCFSAIVALLFVCPLISAQTEDSAFRMQPDSLSKEAGEFRKAIRSGNLPLVLSEEEKAWMDEILFYEQDSTERAEREAEIERENAEKEKTSGNSKDSEPVYSVGAIPLEQGVSPSGARTYSIPIPTAPGFKLVPSVALAYNSQAGEGWAGYGWDIQGISTISLINQNEYYHGCIRAASDTTATPVFALDGMPLVTNDDPATSAAYPLVTATGHILARSVLNPSGYVCKFEVLYPNGSSAVFGHDTSAPSHLVFYKISEMHDLLGNRVVFNYTDQSSSGNDRISSIRYGFDSMGDYSAEIRFTYTYTSGIPIRFFAGETIHYNHHLTRIESFASEELLTRYSLAYIYQDNSYLLSQVDCFNSEEESLPPISFTYGEVPSSAKLTKDASGMCLDASFFSQVYDNVYRRGKFLVGEFRDGLIIHPDFPTYQIIGGDQTHGYCYNAPQTLDTQKIIFVPRLESSNHVDTSLVFGSGFQTIEAVDVDGDGADELVRVNLWGNELSKTKCRISIRNCNPDGTPGQESFFYARLNGTHYNYYYNYRSPYLRDYRWGDFNGDGKIDLLAVAFNRNMVTNGKTQTCYAAVIDINAQSVLSDEVLFDYPLDRRSCLIVCDIDADGKSELCYATDTGFDIYRLQTNGHFAIEKHLSNLTASVFTSNTEPVYLTDLNGDGYADFVQAPPTGTSSIWHAYLYNGTTFAEENLYITSRQSGDSFFFIDVNRDGLADIVGINSVSLRAYINKDVYNFNYSSASPSSISDTKGIIPANVIAYNGMSSFIKVNGLTVNNYSYSAVSPPIRHIKKVTDSYGKQFSNSYVYLPELSSSWTDAAYSPTVSAGYAKVAMPLYVLYIGYYYEYEFSSAPYKQLVYRYYDPVAHNNGLGFCGFHKTRSSLIHYFYQGSFLRSASKKFDITVYDPEKRGVVTSVESRLGININTPPYNSITNTWDSHSTTYGKLAPRLIQTELADSLHGVTTTTEYTYDSFDFPVSIVTERSDGTNPGIQETVSRTYAHSDSVSRYILGTVVKECSDRSAGALALRKWRNRSEWSLDSLFRPVEKREYRGELVRRLLPPPNPQFPDLPQLPQYIDGSLLVSTTRWTYDSFGNVISEKSAPYDATEFLGDTLVYDAAGRFVLSKTDALGHTTSYSGYNEFGMPTAVTDYRGRAKTFLYDSWGNLLQTGYADGSLETVSREWTDGTWSCGSGDSMGRSVYTVTTSCTGKPSRIVHYDALCREVHSGDQRFDGQWRWTDRQYDLDCRLSKVSLPYKTATATATSPAASQWNTYSYDSYDRVTSIAEASGRTTTWSYNGTSTTTVKDGITSTSTTDAAGNVVSVTDAGGTITYTLRDDGQPSSVTAPGNVVTTFSYDGYGRRIGLDDPSVGERTYSYSWNTDGSSQTMQSGPNGTITTSKDKYGRTSSVARTGEFTTTYSYDTYGRLASESSTNGTSTTYTYDTLDRVASVREDALDGKWLKRDYSYGAGSNVASVLYTSQTDTITTEHYSYAYGHNKEILLPDSTVVFRLNFENDLGRPTWIKTGDVSRQYGFNAYGLPTLRRMVVGGGGPHTYPQSFSYTFDAATGNLSSRSDSENGTYESFYYDALNRLSSTTISVGSRIIDHAFSYQDNGNLTYITTVGTVSYDDPECPYKPTSKTNPAYITTPIPRQTIAYNSYDRPVSISQDGITAALTYNGAEDRVKMSVVDSTGTVPATLLTRYYLGRRYEIDSTSTTTTERFYLGGDAYSAPMVLVRTGGSNGSWTAYNIGRDYLGSITHILTADGTPVAEYSYNPWGRQRNPASMIIYSNTGTADPELMLGRGYTGHEFLPWFSLYNMNARLYDPLVGRFLSPDPHVQAPDFTQNFNRYSYCLNNPLKYSDEDGEWVHIVIGAVLGGVGNLIANWDNCDGFWQYAASFGIGALTGAAVAATGGAVAAAGSTLLGTLGLMGVGAASGAINGASGDIIRQTGKNFKGINNVDMGSVGRYAAIGGASGLIGSAFGAAFSAVNMTVNLNGTICNSPIINSFVLGSVASGAGHIAGGTVAGLLDGESFDSAFHQSLEGLASSMIIGGAFSATSTAAYDLAKGINPLNGDQLNGFEISRHARARMTERDISMNDIKNTLEHPLKIGAMTYNGNGQPAIKYYGEKATILTNPETGKIITLYPTHSKTVNSLKNYDKK